MPVFVVGTLFSILGLKTELHRFKLGPNFGSVDGPANALSLTCGIPLETYDMYIARCHHPQEASDGKAFTGDGKEVMEMEEAKL